MSENFTGEIIMFGGTFSIQNWALCNGQILGIADQQALFSLLGTTYGGNGIQTFALPEMRGRIPMGSGQGPGLSNRPIGMQIGSETVPLREVDMPVHTHCLQASSGQANSTSPVNSILANVSNENGTFYETQPFSNVFAMASGQVGSTGKNESHPNMMPYSAVNFQICLTGIYPSRN